MQNLQIRLIPPEFLIDDNNKKELILVYRNILRTQKLRLRESISSLNLSRESMEERMDKIKEFEEYLDILEGLV